MQHPPFATRTLSSLWFYAITSVLLTMFLFYIDEGYYNLKWMTDFGNWIAFVIYGTGLFLGQLFAYKVLFRKYSGRYKTLLICFTGLAIGLIAVVAMLI